MKYIQERLLFRTEEMKKGDILVYRLMELIKKDRSLLNNYDIAPSYKRSIMTKDKIYFIDFEGAFPLPNLGIGELSDKYFLQIYNKKDVIDLDYPNYYKNPCDKYRFSSELFKKMKKLHSGVDVKIPKIEIPEKFLQDKKFVNNLEELSDENMDAVKYNL